MDRGIHFLGPPLRRIGQDKLLNAGAGRNGCSKNQCSKNRVEESSGAVPYSVRRQISHET